MTKYCKVRGRWTGAISSIDTTCRFLQRPENKCVQKEKCQYKTTDIRARLIGKTVTDISKNCLVFSDGSILQI